MPNVGPLEIIIVLVIALVVLGPKRLPDFGRSVGKGMREFKGALTGGSSEDGGRHDDDDDREDELAARERRLEERERELARQR